MFDGAEKASSPFGLTVAAHAHSFTAKVKPNKASAESLGVSRGALIRSVSLTGELTVSRPPLCLSWKASVLLRHGDRVQALSIRQHGGGGAQAVTLRRER
jgi:hypothetical protein